MLNMQTFDPFDSFWRRELAEKLEKLAKGLIPEVLSTIDRRAMEGEAADCGEFNTRRAIAGDTAVGGEFILAVAKEKILSILN